MSFILRPFFICMMGTNFNLLHKRTWDGIDQFVTVRELRVNEVDKT